MQGSLIVDFAGTYSEAQHYAAQHHGLTCPKCAASGGGDGALPMLYYRYKNARQRLEGLALLESLGWDDGSVLDNRYKIGA